MRYFFIVLNIFFIGFYGDLESNGKNHTLDGYEIQTIGTLNNTRFHITGLDVFDDTVYCATRLGEVWTLKNGIWKKYAEGLHEPCGLVVNQNGEVIVTQKPEMTKIVDVNSDGVGDEYINLCNSFKFHNNYHEFNYGGVIDPQGNYVGTLNLSHGDPDAINLSTMGSSGGFRGWAYKVSKNGTFQPIASGLRSPAGLGMSPQGELFFTENQGDYVGTSFLQQIKQGEFYGHPVSLLDAGYTKQDIWKLSDPEFNKLRTLPVVWFPHYEVSNSPGNPVWDTTQGKFGPFENQIFIGDQTLSSIFRVSLQEVKGRYQGCVFNFMEGFQSGVFRLAFDSKGALWVGQTGRGWLSKGDKKYGLQKVVWKGRTPFEVLDIKMVKNGFEISFTHEVDPQSIHAIKLQSWWYEYRRHYGSPKQNLIEESPFKISLEEKKLMINLDLKKKKVYGFDFSYLRSKESRRLTNAKAYYTLIETLD